MLVDCLNRMRLRFLRNSVINQVVFALARDGMDVALTPYKIYFVETRNAHTSPHAACQRCAQALQPALKVV